MTLTNLSSDVSIIWFWVGLFVLLGLAHAYRSARLSLRKALRLREELDTALLARRLELLSAYRQDGELAQIVRSAEEAQTPQESFDREADLDLWIYSKQQQGNAAGAVSTTALRVLETATADLQPFRDRYNEAAAAVVSQRVSFPGAIVVRSLIDSDPPLFPEPEFN